MTRTERDRPAALVASEASQAKAKRENAKHTPGPWELEEWLSDYGATGDYSIFQSRQRGCRMPIASVQQPFNKERTEANARLIAAAPEMLAALKAIVDCAGLGAGPEIGLALDAIQKATGDTE